MKYLLLLSLFLLLSSCAPTAAPVDGGADAAPAVDQAAAADLALAACPAHRLACSQSLPAVNCPPSACEKLPTGALCCVEPAP